MYLILDLETVPDRARWSAPRDCEGQVTQPEPFPPHWAHRIVCAGYMALSDRYEFMDAGAFTDRGLGEHGLILSLSRHIAARKATLVTFNGRNFDLQVIALRSLCHGVPVPWFYDKDVRYRYNERGHLDLCDSLADHGAGRMHTLDALSKLIGLPGKVGCDGSQVESLWNAGRIDDIESYCMSDVAQTALLLLRYRLIQFELGPGEYAKAEAALRDALARDGRFTPVVGAVEKAS